MLNKAKHFQKKKQWFYMIVPDLAIVTEMVRFWRPGVPVKQKHQLRKAPLLQKENNFCSLHAIMLLGLYAQLWGQFYQSTLVYVIIKLVCTNICNVITGLHNLLPATWQNQDILSVVEKSGLTYRKHISLVKLLPASLRLLFSLSPASMILAVVLLLLSLSWLPWLASKTLHVA